MGNDQDNKNHFVILGLANPIVVVRDIQSFPSKHPMDVERAEHGYRPVLPLIMIPQTVMIRISTRLLWFQ